MAQWVIVAGFLFGPRMLARLARVNPGLEPFVFPVIALILGFVMLTWIASPLFNFLLRFNRFGRLALSNDQRVASSWIGGCFVLALVCFVAALAKTTAVALFGTGYFGFLLLPLAVTFSRVPGTPQRVMAGYTAFVALLGLPVMSLLLLGNASPWKDETLAFQLVPFFVLARLGRRGCRRYFGPGAWSNHMPARDSELSGRSRPMPQAARLQDRESCDEPSSIRNRPSARGPRSRTASAEMPRRSPISSKESSSR